MQGVASRLIDRLMAATVAAYMLTAIHHVYGGLVDAAANRLLVPAIMAVPLLLMLGSLRRYRRTDSAAALALATGVAAVAWVLLSGLLHGGYAHVYKDLVFLLGGSPALYYPLNPSEHYPPDDLFFEVTGALELATAAVIGSLTIRLIHERRRWLREERI